MRQTDHYKLNLIDAMDTFSPAPLNENTELLEQALSAVHTEVATGIATEIQTRAAADTALASRVTVLEGHKFAVGSYTGKGTKAGDYQTVNVGFTPKAVFVDGNGLNAMHLAVTGQSVSALIEIVSGGFKVGYGTSIAGSGNTNGILYRYAAIC